MNLLTDPVSYRWLLMGWLALLAFVPLVAILSYRGFAWLAAGARRWGD